LLLEVNADQVSYNTVIHAYQRSKLPNAGEEAERLLNMLQSLYESSGDPSLRPDVVTYCSLLGVHANTGNARRAEDLLLQFHKEHTMHPDRAAPDTACLDQVLLAWARKGGEQGAKRANMLLKLMEVC